MCSINILVANRPASRRGICTTVIDGAKSLATQESNTHTTERSSGTRRPREIAADVAPIAAFTLAMTTAVIGSSESKSVIIAAAPAGASQPESTHPAGRSPLSDIAAMNPDRRRRAASCASRPPIYAMWVCPSSIRC
jgi:hypothetical protein